MTTTIALTCNVCGHDTETGEGHYPGCPENPGRPDREPAVEVFKLTEAHFHPDSSLLSLFRDDDEIEDLTIGELREIRNENVGKWVWWSCHPGCLPDGNAFGPFDTENEAIANMRDEYDIPVHVTFYADGGDVFNEDGTLTEWDDENGERSVVVYLDRVDAIRESSVMGSSVESPRDLTVAYSMVSVRNTEDWPDVLARMLYAEGYSVTWDTDSPPRQAFIC